MGQKDKKPVILIILDGWGAAPLSSGNAITRAKKPFFESLMTICPVMTLEASGETVGLIWGERGNSEVGHLTLGSGRIIYQSRARINKSIIDGDFFKNGVLHKAIEHAQSHGGNFHLIGLVSPGGVHSHQEHLYALLDFFAQKKISNIFIHAILDGRDTKKDEGEKSIRLLLKKVNELKTGGIASISGRFYAMDRDNHWGRIEKAYKAISEETSEKKFSDPLQAIRDSYEHGVFDEEFFPTVIKKDDLSSQKITENDSVIFFNFRPDRARQLTSAFVLPGFEKFKRKSYLKNLFFATFTQYDKNLPVEIIFPPEEVKNTLAEVISSHSLRQLHIAETEKYAHVTYFFNGGKEQALTHEERILIPSPLVSSYDQKPEMSAFEITARTLKEISKNNFDFMVMNFANADMVGHTGNMEATIQAIEVLDKCLEKIVRAAVSKDGTVIITADHGNAEEMLSVETGEATKDHSKNPVPCVIASKRLEEKSQNYNTPFSSIDVSALTPSGMLADVAPTILKILNLPIPQEMIGKPLI